MTIMTIGKNIAELRKNSGMTQEQLAETLGVSAQTISKWENEVTMPDIMLLPVIAGCFNITIDELEELVSEISPSAEFNKTMLAEEFRQSLSTNEVYSSDFDVPNFDEE